MNNRTTLLFACLAGLGMSYPCFAGDYSENHPGNIGYDIDMRIKFEESAWDAYRARDVVETGGPDEQQVTSGQVQAVGNFADRFINPHPELGCLYYDENNVRHWFPNCREL